jgi:hypothetical protein
MLKSNINMLLAKLNAKRQKNNLKTSSNSSLEQTKFDFQFWKSDTDYVWFPKAMGSDLLPKWGNQQPQQQHKLQPPFH